MTHHPNMDRFSADKLTHLDATDDPIEREAPELTPEEEMDGIYDNSKTKLSSGN